MKINIKGKKIIAETSEEVELIELPVYDRHDDGETNFVRVLPLKRRGKIYAYRVTTIRKSRIFDETFHLWEISDGSKCQVGTNYYIGYIKGERPSYTVKKEQFDSYLKEVVKNLK